MDKFIIPVDFIILNIELDEDVFIIFGRPFLAKRDAVIRANNKTITFRINGEEVIFYVNYATHYPKKHVGCYHVELLDTCVKGFSGHESCVESFTEAENSDYDTPCVVDEENKINCKDGVTIGESCLVIEMSDEKVGEVEREIELNHMASLPCDEKLEIVDVEPSVFDVKPLCHSMDKPGGSCGLCDVAGLPQVIAWFNVL